MESKEVKQYAECLISMSADFLAGGISEQTYMFNLNVIFEKLFPEKAEKNENWDPNQIVP
jgi:hypothetical protein